MSAPRNTYCIEYETHTGERKIFKDKIYGGVKEFVKYNNALRIKNWFLDHGFENVRIKEIRY